MFKKWFEERKQARRDLEKLRGYRFAASLILMQKLDAVEQLRSNIECSFHFDDYKDFDEGIASAINDAVSLGIAEEEEW